MLLDFIHKSYQNFVLLLLLCFFITPTYIQAFLHYPIAYFCCKNIFLGCTLHTEKKLNSVTPFTFPQISTVVSLRSYQFVKNGKVEKINTF